MNSEHKTKMQFIEDGKEIRLSFPILFSEPTLFADGRPWEIEELSFSMFNDSPIPILIINRDKTIRYLNPAFEELTGFSMKDLINRNVPYPWWTRTSLEEMPYNEIRNIERFYQKKNGKHFWVEVTSFPIKIGDEITFFLSSWIDITEKKRSEELLRLALESTGNGVWERNLQTNEVFYSKSWKEMLGYEEHEIGNNIEEWSKRIHPSDMNMLYEEIEKHFR